MTKEQAIKILQDNKGAVVMDSEFEQAYNLAISALSAEELPTIPKSKAEGKAVEE